MNSQAVLLNYLNYLMNLGTALLNYISGLMNYYAVLMGYLIYRTLPGAPYAQNYCTPALVLHTTAQEYCRSA
jgi:hypothetical protein